MVFRETLRVYHVFAAIANCDVDPHPHPTHATLQALTQCKAVGRMRRDVLFCLGVRAEDDRGRACLQFVELCKLVLPLVGSGWA